jgi:hypothetical protein
VAIRPIRLERSLSWKKIAKESKESRRIGMNIVKREFEGYL